MQIMPSAGGEEECVLACVANVQRGGGGGRLKSEREARWLGSGLGFFRLKMSRSAFVEDMRRLFYLKF